MIAGRRRWTRAVRWTLLLVLTVLAPARPAAGGGRSEPSPPRAGCQPPFRVGFKVEAPAGGARMALWYPSSEVEAPFRYFRELRGSVARAGAVADCARFPLIVFSHGFSGCGTQSVFFTEELARRGYVVVAPDHKDALCSVEGDVAFRYIAPDASFARPDLWTESTHANRRDDIRRAIGWVLEATEFEGRIDRDRIGAVGHSLGGYTVLGLAGGWTGWADDRIKASLLLAPYAAPFVVHQRMAAVRGAVMYQTADGDVMISPSAVRSAYERSGTPKHYVQLRGGSHFEWTNLVCVGTATISDCLRSRRNARLINEYGLAFLDGYLKGQTEPLKRLDGSAVSAYRVER